MYYTLEGIEAGVAALAADDGSCCRLPAASLPAGAAVGAVLCRAQGAWHLCPDETAARAAKSAALLAALRRKATGRPQG